MMKFTSTMLAIVGGSILLSACVTPTTGIKIANSMVNTVGKVANGVSKSSCDTQDWRARGYSDATKDRMITAATQLEETCREPGKTFDKPKYLAGYEQGLNDHCTADLGTKHGNSVVDYTSPCDSVPAYASAYKTSSSTVMGFEVLTGKDAITAMGGTVSETVPATEKTLGNEKARRKLVSKANSLAQGLNNAARSADKYSKGSEKRSRYTMDFDYNIDEWVKANYEARRYIKTHFGIKPLATFELTKVKPYKGFDKSKIQSSKR